MATKKKAKKKKAKKLTKLDDMYNIFEYPVWEEAGTNNIYTYGNLKLNEETSSQNSKEALRFDNDKLRFDLLPTEVVIELARAYSMGAIKYGDNNYRKGMAWNRCVRSAFSHFYKWLSGKAIDEETGCHHLALAAWNLLTLLYYEINKVGTDNRNKFNIDDNFNWTDNHLGIGLSKEKLSALKEQYKNKRSPQ